MSELSIRIAKPSDVEVLAELQAATFWEAYHTSDRLVEKRITAYIAGTFDLERTRSDLLDKRTVFLLAEIDGRLAGFARLLPESSRPEVLAEKPLEISRIYLRKNFWGKGFGAMLLERCFEEAEKQLCDVIWLSVWEYNHRAISFYESFDFRNVGSHPFDLAGSEQTDLIMQKNLKVKK